MSIYFNYFTYFTYFTYFIFFIYFTYFTSLTYFTYFHYFHFFIFFHLFHLFYLFHLIHLIHLFHFQSLTRGDQWRVAFITNLKWWRVVNWKSFTFNWESDKSFLKEFCFQLGCVETSRYCHPFPEIQTVLCLILI